MNKPKKNSWIVMKLYKWDSLSIDGRTAKMIHEGAPIGFMPVFRTKKEAVDFNKSRHGIREIEPK